MWRWRLASRVRQDQKPNDHVDSIPQASRFQGERPYSGWSGTVWGRVPAIGGRAWWRTWRDASYQSTTSLRLAFRTMNLNEFRQVLNADVLSEAQSPSDGSDVVEGVIGRERAFTRLVLGDLEEAGAVESPV